MALVPVAARSSFFKELWEALLEVLWDEVKEQAMERCLRYLYHKFLEREEPPPAPLPDFAQFLVADGDTAAETAVFGPRPGPPFRLGDGNPRPGFLFLLLDGEVRQRPPPTSGAIGVDHVPIPDSFFYPSDAERYAVPVFARRAPRLGPVLGCGASPLSPPRPPRSVLVLPPPPPPPSSGPTPPPSVPGAHPIGPAASTAAVVPGFLSRHWHWLALGVAAAAVVALVVFARRRSQRRRRAAEEEARRGSTEGTDGTS
ncbi:wiskott-Aldrich syndrome protein family member 2-like [Triticum aestivum]|nr:wiskott-Aldrich syndrome protein family member 2-like [Triticum aestivum]